MKPAAVRWDSRPTCWLLTPTSSRFSNRRLMKPSQTRWPDLAALFLSLTKRCSAMKLTFVCFPKPPARESPPMRLWCRWSTWRWWSMSQWGSTPLQIAWRESQRPPWKSRVWPSRKAPSSPYRSMPSIVILICGRILKSSSLKGALTLLYQHVEGNVDRQLFLNSFFHFSFAQVQQREQRQHWSLCLPALRSRAQELHRHEICSVDDEVGPGGDPSEVHPRHLQGDGREKKSHTLVLLSAVRWRPSVRNINRLSFLLPSAGSINTRCRWIHHTQESHQAEAGAPGHSRRLCLKLTLSWFRKSLWPF